MKQYKVCEVRLNETYDCPYRPKLPTRDEYIILEEIAMIGFCLVLSAMIILLLSL